MENLVGKNDSPQIPLVEGEILKEAYAEFSSEEDNSLDTWRKILQKKTNNEVFAIVPEISLESLMLDARDDLPFTKFKKNPDFHWGEDDKPVIKEGPMDLFTRIRLERIMYGNPEKQKIPVEDQILLKISSNYNQRSTGPNNGDPRKTLHSFWSYYLAEYTKNPVFKGFTIEEIKPYFCRSELLLHPKNNPAEEMFDYGTKQSELLLKDIL